MVWQIAARDKHVNSACARAMLFAPEIASSVLYDGE